MKKNQIALAVGTIVLLTIILLLPDFKGQDEIKFFYEYKRSQITSIEYQGRMKYKTKLDIFAHYRIVPEANELADPPFQWKINVLEARPYKEEEVENIGKDISLKDQFRDPKGEVDEVDKNQTAFYGGAITKAIIDEQRKFQYLYKFKLETKNAEKKKKEYGFIGCHDKFILTAANDRHEFCIGGWNYGKSKRYLYLAKENTVFVIQNYLMNRLQNKIFGYRLPSDHQRAGKNFQI